MRDLGSTPVACRDFNVVLVCVHLIFFVNRNKQTVVFKRKQSIQNLMTWNMFSKILRDDWIISFSHQKASHANMYVRNFSLDTVSWGGSEGEGYAKSMQ